MYFLRLQRAAMPYLRITRLTRFFPVPSSAANFRCPIVSSFSWASSMRTANALSSFGRFPCTYRLLRAMPSTEANWLLLIGLSEAHSLRASSTFCCLLISPTVRGIFLGSHFAPSVRQSAFSDHRATRLVHIPALCSGSSGRAGRQKSQDRVAGMLASSGSPLKLQG